MSKFIGVTDEHGMVNRVKVCLTMGTLTGRFSARNPAETNPPRSPVYRSTVFPNDESICEGYCVVYNRDGTHRIGRITNDYTQSKMWERVGRLTDKPIYRLRIKNVRKGLTEKKGST